MSSLKKRTNLFFYDDQEQFYFFMLRKPCQTNLALSYLGQEDGSFNIHAKSSEICAYTVCSLHSHMACLLVYANSKQNKTQIK